MKVLEVIFFIVAYITVSFLVGTFMIRLSFYNQKKSKKEKKEKNDIDGKTNF